MTDPNMELMKPDSQSDGLGAVATRTNETAGMVLAEKAKAAIQARIVQAIQRPRDPDACRTRVLSACRRPRFAEAARYQVQNRGAGASIRFAEEFARNWGNIVTETIVVYDDFEKRIVNTTTTDMETNTPFSFDVVIMKTVERNKASGREVLETRKNTYGKEVYILRATEEEVLTKVNSAVSKAMRTNILRHCPSDVMDEAMELCISTVRDRDAKDPEAAKKAIIDAFTRLNVMPGDLAEYLKCSVAQASPAQLTELRGVWTLLNEGASTWAEVLAEVTGDAPDEKKVTTKDKVAAKLSKAKAAKKKAEPATDLAGKLAKAYAAGMQGNPDADAPFPENTPEWSAYEDGLAARPFDANVAAAKHESQQ